MVRSYSLGARAVIDVRVARNGSELVVTALEPGKTALLVVRKDGDEIRYPFRVLDDRRRRKPN